MKWAVSLARELVQVLEQPQVVGGAKVEGIQLVGRVQRRLREVFLAALRVQQTEAVARVGPPGGAVDRDLVHRRRARVLPHRAELLGHFEAGRCVIVIDVDLIDLLQHFGGLVVLELKCIGRGEQSHCLDVLRLLREDALDRLDGVRRASLLQQVARFQQVCFDRVGIDLANLGDRFIAAVEIELLDRNPPRQRQAAQVGRVSGGRFLQLIDCLLGVVVREVVLGGGDVGRPVAAIDDVIRRARTCSGSHRAAATRPCTRR
jgi:hypothetical protein